MDPHGNIYWSRTQATVIEIERKKGRILFIEEHTSIWMALQAVQAYGLNIRPTIQARQGGGGHLVFYSMVLTGSLHGCWSGGRRETASCGYSTHEFCTLVLPIFLLYIRAKRGTTLWQNYWQLSDTVPGIGRLEVTNLTTVQEFVRLTLSLLTFLHLKTKFKFSPNIIIDVTLKKEHPAFKKKKYLSFLLFLWVIFALLVLDPSNKINADPANPDSNSKPWQYQSYFLLQLREIQTNWTKEAEDQQQIGHFPLLKLFHKIRTQTLLSSWEFRQHCFLQS
jgi:hypothetical protein